MSRVCQITGRGTRTGCTIARRGLAKAKGGVGVKTTGITKRKFKVNVQEKRIWVPELGEHVRLRLSTRALKTITKRGPYPVLVEAGLIKPRRGNARRTKRS
jgi:large subunit ribosomal protein L28